MAKLTAADREDRERRKKLESIERATAKAIEEQEEHLDAIRRSVIHFIVVCEQLLGLPKSRTRDFERCHLHELERLRIYLETKALKHHAKLRRAGAIRSGRNPKDRQTTARALNRSE